VERNTLYYGDNLDVLQRHVKDESVDLVSLDPPFNSNATYNVLFREHDETRRRRRSKRSDGSHLRSEGAWTEGHERRMPPSFGRVAVSDARLTLSGSSRTRERT
jgi:DNA modification methylase